jgi:hypothetical protein
MEKLWSPLHNVFDNATKKSKAKMLLISNDHEYRLAAAKDDPTILELYNQYQPEAASYRNLMAQWDSSKGIGKSRTMSWEDKLDNIAATIFNVWEGKVYSVYPKGTPEALAIFPNGKTAFISGKYEERLVLFDALLITLAEFPPLAELRTDIAKEIEGIKLLRQQQQEQFGKISINSGRVEEQRKLLADLLDDDLCRLKIKYRKNLPMVEKFYDLALLRRTINDSDGVLQFSGTVEAGMSYMVALPEKLAVGTNTTCTFTNLSSSVDLQFFFAANGTDTDGATKATVRPNESATGTAAESGWLPGANFVIVKNMGGITADFEGLLVTAVPES